MTTTPFSIKNILSMLSPYITILYIISVYCRIDDLNIMLTPITWIVCVFGLLIILYKRFINNDILPSYIWYQLFGVKTDLPPIVFKFCIITLLIQQNKPFTNIALILAGIIIATYITFINVIEVYDI